MRCWGTERKKTEEKWTESKALWDTIKETNIHILSFSGKKKGAERIFDGITAENFPNLMKDMNMNIQLRWTQRNPHWDTF